MKKQKKFSRPAKFWGLMMMLLLLNQALYA